MLEQHLSFLKNNQNVLVHGLVEKRTFINYNFYYLAIFKDLSMIRIKSEQPEKKREMHIKINKKSNEVPASLINGEKFKLNTN